MERSVQGMDPLRVQESKINGADPESPETKRNLLKNSKLLDTLVK
jgi:hypothetical protein